MRVRTSLRKDDPYYESKTDLQWKNSDRMVIDPENTGEEMWVNRHHNVSAVYYTFDDTRPAEPGELEKWKAEQKAKAQEQRRKLKERKEREERELREAEAAAKVREKERKKKILARVQRYADIKPEEIICLDTETTGLESEDEILQLSIIDGTGDVLFDEYIRPVSAEEWPYAEMIHGISPDMVADKATIDQHLERLNEIIASAKLVIGYHLDFDLDYLHRAGMTCPKDVLTFDVMTEFAAVYGEWSHRYRDFKWQSLAVCADFFGYTGKEPLHNSLEDVRATLFCYFSMLKLTEDDLTGSEYEY